MSGDEKFSWDDEESVVIGQVHAVAVYSNQKGDIVIRQQNPEWNLEEGGQDGLIIIPPNKVGKLINALKKETSLSGMINPAEIQR